MSANHPNAINYPPTQGMSESAPFKTISWAVSQAGAGDTIWVKTGNYDSANDAEAVADGGPNGFNDHLGINIDKKLTLIGYHTTPGDLDQGEGVPSNNQEFDDICQGYPPGNIKLQPTIIGTDRNILPVIVNSVVTVPRRVGVKVTGVTTSYVDVRNFTIRQFSYGAESRDANHTSFQNTLTCETGKIDDTSSRTCWGRGITFNNSPDGSIYNCRVRNCAGIGIDVVVNSDRTTVQNTDVYCDDNQTGAQSATDYYFHILHCEDCVMDYCQALKLPDTSVSPSKLPEASGHGFIIAGWIGDLAGVPCADNEVKNCYVQDCSECFLFLGEEVESNCVTDCHSLRTVPDDSTIHGAIYFANGAKDNYVLRTKLENARSAITFDVWRGRDGNPTFAASGNTIENCVFDQCENAIGFHAFNQYVDDKGTSDPSDDELIGDPNIPAVDNVLRNCTIICRETSATYGGSTDRRALVYCNRANSGTEIENCIVDGFPTDETSLLGVGSTNSSFPYFAANLSMYFNCFYDNTGISYPAQNVTATADPLIDHLTFELDPNSPGGIGCVNAGTAVTETMDFDKSSRVLGGYVDIGAQESQ
ncbi:hypothetical protein ACFL2H_06000 [Planctomycetota bacterium]